MLVSMRQYIFTKTTRTSAVLGGVVAVAVAVSVSTVIGVAVVVVVLLVLKSRRKSSHNR